jgi:ADP-ribose pyrophosphatase YjhB (NUDIX family)
MYCVDCGSALIENLIEGRTRQICPSCATIAYQLLKVGAGVLVAKEGKLLLQRRSPDSDAFAGTWNLPAGHCEVDESPRATAVREAAEEAGLDLSIGRLVDVYYFDDDPRGNGLLIVFEAEVKGNAPEAADWTPTDGEEVSASGFFAPDELPKPLCGGGHDQAIAAWKARTLDRWRPGTPMRNCPHCTHPLEERISFDRLRPVCIACGFVHFRDPKVGVSVLIEGEGKVLLVQRVVDPERGKWCLPSGFAEWDEPPEMAAARECAEETGLAVTDLNLLGVAHYTDDFRGPGISLNYRAAVAGGELRPGDDAGAARWFAPTELPPAEEIAFRSHRTLLEAWQRGQSAPPASHASANDGPT